MRKNKKGFTLIELLTTILIIGIVMTITFIGISGFIEKSRDKKLAISIASLKDTAKMYAKEYYTANDWIDDNNSTSIFTCVSRNQIIDKGLIKKDKTNDLGIDYVILGKNKNSQMITTKATLSMEDYEKSSENITISNDVEKYSSICKRTVIEKPRVKNVVTYTDSIKVTFKITPKLTNSYNLEDGSTEERTIRDINSASCELKIKGNDGDYNSFEPSKILDFDPEIINGDELECEFNGLRYEKDETVNKYKISLSIEYDDKENPYVGDKENISLKKLSNPVILIDGQKEESTKYTLYKDITINYSRQNIRDGVEINISNNLSNISGNEIRVEDTDDEIFKKIKKTITENNAIEASISDGTNTITSTKQIKYIDNTNYVCDVKITPSEDKSYALLDMFVYDSANPSKDVSNNILGYQLPGESYIPFKRNRILNIENLLTSKKISTNSTFNMTIKNRREEGHDNYIQCIKDISGLDVEAPLISIYTYKSSDNTQTVQDNWYSDTLYANIITEQYAKINYCIVDSIQGNCEPYIEVSANNFGNTVKTITKTTDGIWKIIAIATDVNGNSSEPVSAYLKVDKTPPPVPAFLIKNLSKVNKTADFYKKDTWKNYAITWTIPAVRDALSGTLRYEYSTNCSGNKDGNAWETDTYYNNNVAYCLRSVDGAENPSAWSDPYYFKIDTTYPTITINAYKRNGQGGKTGAIIGSKTANNSNRTVYLNSYSNQVNGWLNKDKYPNGLYFEISFSDTNLSSGKWEWNAGNLFYNSSNVNTVSGNKNLSVSSGIHSDYVDGDGYRKLWLRIKDQAGNESVVDITAPIDTSIPDYNVGLYKKTSSNNITSSTGLSTYKNNTWTQSYVYTNIYNVKDVGVSGLSTARIDYSGATGTGNSSISCSSSKCNMYRNIDHMGVSTVTFKVCDNAGNCRTSNPRTIKEDRTPPDFTLVPVAQSKVNTDGGYGLCLKVFSDQSLTKSTLSNVKDVCPTGHDTYRGYTVTYNYKYKDQVTQDWKTNTADPYWWFRGNEGEYKACAFIKVTDAVGNSKTKTFKIDKTGTSDSKGRYNSQLVSSVDGINKNCW